MKVSLDKLPESRPYMYFFNGMDIEIYSFGSMET